jgi:hypothetical protein
VHLAYCADKHRAVDGHAVIVLVVGLKQLMLHPANDQKVHEGDVLRLHAQEQVVAQRDRRHPLVQRELVYR